MILSFNDYILDNRLAVRRSDARNKNDAGILTEISPPRNYKLFDGFNDRCPFCKVKTEIVFVNDDILDQDRPSIFVNQCLTCGWWLLDYNDGKEKKIDSKIAFTSREIIYYSLLKAFNPSDLALPISTLFNELSKDKNILYQIHPTKFELLVKEVLKDFFNCEVHHVGKVNDGGKDLILILKDEPVLVQVKRRSKNASVESVSTVRDLLGAMFIGNSKKGMIVSTADHFSKKSTQVKNSLITSGKLNYFELINFKNFCEMLELIKRTNRQPWEKLLTKWKKK